VRLIPKNEVVPQMLIVCMEENENGKRVAHVGRTEYRETPGGKLELFAVWVLIQDRRSDSAWVGPSNLVRSDEEKLARARGGIIESQESLRGAWLSELEGDAVNAIGCNAPASGEGLRGAVERALLAELLQKHPRLTVRP